jgi:hypothetical protein
MAHSVVAGGAFLALKQTPRYGAGVRVIGSGGANWNSHSPEFVDVELR